MKKKGHNISTPSLAVPHEGRWALWEELQRATEQRGPCGLSPDSQGFGSTDCAEKSLELEVRAMGVWPNSALKDLGGPKGVRNLPRVLSHVSTVRVGVLKSLWSYRLPSESE